MVLRINGTVTQGHCVASGKSASSPYPAGSVSMQAPFFKALGLDLSGCYMGTLNVAVESRAWRIVQPTHRFENVLWTHLHPAENFSFVRCNVTHLAQTVQGWLYHPHPETKAAHWQSSNVMEIIAPPLDTLAYGQRLVLEYADGALTTIDEVV
jgi:hypothetical protein